jgi:hypothetical protein
VIDTTGRSIEECRDQVLAEIRRSRVIQ